MQDFDETIETLTSRVDDLERRLISVERDTQLNESAAQLDWDRFLDLETSVAHWERRLEEMRVEIFEPKKKKKA